MWWWLGRTKLKLPRTAVISDNLRLWPHRTKVELIGMIASLRAMWPLEHFTELHQLVRVKKTLSGYYYENSVDLARPVKRPQVICRSLRTTLENIQFWVNCFLNKVNIKKLQ